MSAKYLKIRATAHVERKYARLLRRVRTLSKLATKHRQKVARREQVILELLALTVRPTDVSAESWNRYQKIKAKYKPDHGTIS